MLCVDHLQVVCYAFEEQKERTKFSHQDNIPISCISLSVRDES